MKNYYSAITAASQLTNMPNPESNPTKFIQWSEDICELLASIYSEDYDTVVFDLQEKLGLIEDEEDEEDEIKE